MIKQEIMVKGTVVCDLCGKVITDDSENWENRKYGCRSACILCGKDLCNVCGDNYWQYRGCSFALCPEEHNPTIKELEEAIKAKLPV